MYLIENIFLAVAGLKSNKMRAILTMLGIIIGIGSVVAIVMVGDSLTSSVTSSMESMGGSNIIVSLKDKDSDDAFGGPMGDAGQSSSITESDLITDDMIDTFMNIYDDSVEAVSLSHTAGNGKAQEGNVYANITVMGVNDGYELSNNFEMLEGRFIRDGDIKANRYVAVVSDKFVNNMFRDNVEPLGQEIKINLDDQIQTFTVVGIYKYEQSGFAGVATTEKDIRTNMYIPIGTSKMIMSADNGYSNLTVMGKTGVDVDIFAEQIKNFFNRYYVNNTKFEVTTTSMQSITSTFSNMLGTISIAISIIAGISLLVGGIGVMNIMLVSVTERTREIGTRKALGARGSYIRIQFIVESIIICAIGGLIGIVLGVSLGYMGSSMLGFAGQPSVIVIVLAFLFSMLIGVFFGYYPANKASKMDPIEALRYE